MNLSIVIPHHDRADMLQECLKSIPMSIPVYVVRGGSFAENCNTGFCMVKTEYVMFLNDDTRVDNLFNYPLLLNNVDVLGIPSVQNGDIYNGVSIHINQEWPFKEEIGVPDFPLGSCFIIRSRCFCEMRLFNESYINGCEDIDLFLRCIEHGYKFKYHKIPVFHEYSQSHGRGKNIKANRMNLLNNFTPDRLETIKELLAE